MSSYYRENLYIYYTRFHHLSEVLVRTARSTLSWDETDGNKSVGLFDRVCEDLQKRNFKIFPSSGTFHYLVIAV